MSKELILTSKDLNEVGINSSLSSNDLIEVVAHDIYDSYIASVNDVIKRGDKISDKYLKLMDAEFSKMKRSLKGHLSPAEKIIAVDEEDFNDYEENSDALCSFTKVDEYWPDISLWNLRIVEKDKGTVIDKNTRRFNIPSLKKKTVVVDLSITTGTKTDRKEVKTGSIIGTIETSIKKSFSQKVTVPIERFKSFAAEVIAHNKEVDALMEFIPKNGALSVDRFTREARVKMNKKIISAQSPDFKKKISQLFNIKL